MSAIDQLFQQRRAAGRKAFMPFVTAGDPDLEFTQAVVRELARARLRHLRAGDSLQRSDCRRTGDSGVLHPRACSST